MARGKKGKGKNAKPVSSAIPPEPEDIADAVIETRVEDEEQLVAEEAEPAVEEEPSTENTEPKLNLDDELNSTPAMEAIALDEPVEADIAFGRMSIAEIAPEVSEEGDQTEFDEMSLEPSVTAEAEVEEDLVYVNEEDILPEEPSMGITSNFSSNSPKLPPVPSITTDVGADESGLFESISLDAIGPIVVKEVTEAEEELIVEETSEESKDTLPIEEATLDVTPSLSDSVSSTPPSTATATPAVSTSSLQLSTPAPDLAMSEITASPRKGPSMMQKIVSLTRQRDLPPKSKLEETRHLRELEAMRISSQAVEKRRKSQVEADAVLRSAHLASTLPIWEKMILPNWRAVLRHDPEGTKLKSLWWSGTMPVRFRGRLWGMTIGNGLAIGKSAFATSLARANALISAGKYPEVAISKLDSDIAETMPLLRLFQVGGVMHEDLKNLLLAYSVFRDGATPRYPSGISYPAALLMINMTPPEAFLSLVNLVEKSLLKSFYCDEMADIDAYSRIFDTLLSNNQTKVYTTFSQELVRPSLYLIPWISTIFIRYLPLDLSTRLFDVFLIEGDSFLFRVALVMLEILEPRLFNPVLAELVSVFRGEDKGAVAVVRRTKERDESGKIEIEEVFEEMGCTESAIFERLQKLDLKEDSWERLVERELPDAN